MPKNLFFIKNNFEYNKLKKIIDEIYFDDKVLPNQVFRQKYEKFLCEEFDLMIIDDFQENIKILSNLSDDKEIIFGTISPEPDSYYYKYFGYYSVVKLPINITNEQFYDLIEYAPKNNEADSIRFRSDILICMPLSKKWAIYGSRDYEICILGFQSEYIKQIKSFLPRWIPIEDTINKYMYPFFKVMPEFLTVLNISKNDLKNKIIKNYTNL